MGVPHDEFATIYANALIDRAVLNKCNSCILDDIYSCTVLLSYALIHLRGFHSTKRWRIFLIFPFLSFSLWYLLKLIHLCF